MSIGPGCGDVVLLVIPQRERALVRVDAVGIDEYELYLLEEPVTPSSLLSRSNVFVQYAGHEGISRVLGKVCRIGTHHLRFTRIASPQLLRRTEAVHAPVALPVTVLRVDTADQLATEAQTVDVGATGFVLRELADAAPGQVLHFELHLRPGGRPVIGECTVTSVADDGRVTTELSDISQPERARIVHFATDPAPLRAAS